MSCYISFFKLKSFDQFNTPQTASNFIHLLSCGTIVRLSSERLFSYFSPQVRVCQVRSHSYRIYSQRHHLYSYRSHPFLYHISMSRYLYSRESTYHQRIFTFHVIIVEFIHDYLTKVQYGLPQIDWFVHGYLNLPHFTHH